MPSCPLITSCGVEPGPNRLVAARSLDIYDPVSVVSLLNTHKNPYHSFRTRNEHIQAACSVLRHTLHEQRVESRAVQLVGDRTRDVDTFGHAGRRARPVGEGLANGFVEAIGRAREVEGFEGREGVEDDDSFGAMFRTSEAVVSVERIVRAFVGIECRRYLYALRFWQRKSGTAEAALGNQC